MKAKKEKKKTVRSIETLSIKDLEKTIGGRAAPWTTVQYDDKRIS